MPGMDHLTGDRLAVLSSTFWVIERSRSVALEPTAVAAVAAQLAAGEFAPPPWNTHYHLTGTPAETAFYLLVLDTLNFCFWGEPRWRISFEGELLDGYWALAAALKRALHTGELRLDAAALATMTNERLAVLLAGEGTIPLLAERVTALRELGQVLAERWGGDVLQLIAASEGSAPRLAALVAREFTSFNDVASYAGRQIRFFKRAQIFVGDLYGAFNGQGLGSFEDVDQLTAFADYKVPQVLRRLGILVYTSRLATMVDNRIELPAGSPEEVEIRAATIWGVEELRQAMARQGRTVTAYQLDWYLWQLGQQSQADKPYHRTRTIYY